MNVDDVARPLGIPPCGCDRHGYPALREFSEDETVALLEARLRQAQGPKPVSGVRVGPGDDTIVVGVDAEAGNSVHTYDTVIFNGGPGDDTLDRDDGSVFDVTPVVIGIETDV